MAKGPSKFQQWWKETQSLLDERNLWRNEATRFHKFTHFCVLLARSFARSRCPVRASSLAFATLLALVPMLAVVMSVTSTFLKQEGEEQIDQFIVKMVASMTPPDTRSTNTIVARTNVTLTITATDKVTVEDTNSPSGTAQTTLVETNVIQVAKASTGTNEIAMPDFVQTEDAIQARKQIARTINQFIQNTRSGALGVTGTVALIFVAISMLVRIEDAFNEIWGVQQGRSWFMRVVLYWGVISLAPLLLMVALALATGPHLESTTEFLSAMPFVSNLLFQFLPIAVLVITFSLFYVAVPNVKVRWDSALVGGAVAGCAFHVNNLISVLYVSRVVSNSKIYGSLGLIPVFMIGLYFSWLIVLFGAQVAYAYQNRSTYLEEKQVENINQRGQEFVALRLMTLIAQHFVNRQPPPTITQMSEQLSVPGRLVRDEMQILTSARLVVETSNGESAFVPARPIETITCYDVLMAIRAHRGQEFATRDEPTRAEVYGEFLRIQQAEEAIASSVTLLALVNRTKAQLEINGPSPEKLVEVAGVTRATN